MGMTHIELTKPGLTCHLDKGTPESSVVQVVRVIPFAIFERDSVLSSRP